MDRLLPTGEPSHKVLSVPAAGRPSISLVLPVLNAEKTLARIVRAADEALARVTADYEILLVDVGSDDATQAVAATTMPLFPAMRLLDGVAGSLGDRLRAGIAVAKKTCVVLTGANALLGSHDLERLAPLGQHGDLACASPLRNQESLITRGISWGYNLLANILLGTNVRDSRPPLLMTRREVLVSLSPASGSTFLTTELLAQARLAGLSIVEVDMPQREAAVLKSSPWEPIRCCLELVRYWWTTLLFPTRDDAHTAGEPSATSQRIWPIWGLIAIAAVVLFARLTFPLIEPDEARYALIAVSMLDSGDLLVPQREGSFYLDKPPLLYWMTVASFWAFGVHDYAARTVTALSGLGTLLTTYFVGRQLVGRRAAWLGALMLLLSLGFVLASRFLIMDGMLTCFTTLGLLSMYAATQTSQLRRGWWITAALACGFGVMTKGPIALVLTLPPWIASRWLTREGAVVRMRDWLWFAAGVAAVSLPWFVAVAIREPAFLKYFFWEHHIMRYTTNMIHVEPWWFYIPVLAIGMFPACVLLPILGVYLLRRERGVACCRTRSQGFLLLSALWTIAFFSAGTGKLAPYILPAIPMICLLLGAMLDRGILSEVNDKFLARMRRWIPFHFTRTALLAGVVLGVVDFIIDGGEPDQWVESFVLVFGSMFLYWYVSRRSFAERPARWVFAAAVPLAVLAIGIVDIYPTIATKRSLATQIEKTRRATGDEDTLLICFGRYEDSLLFYNRDKQVRLYNVEQLDDVRTCIEGHARVLVLSQEEFIPSLREHLPASIALEELPDSRGKIYLASTAKAAEQVTTGRAADARR